MSLQNCRITKSKEKCLFLASYCLTKDIVRSCKVIFSKVLPEKVMYMSSFFVSCDFQ